MRLVRFNYALIGRGGRIRTLKTSFGERQFTVELTPLLEDKRGVPLLSLTSLLL